MNVRQHSSIVRYGWYMGGVGKDVCHVVQSIRRRGGDISTKVRCNIMIDDEEAIFRYHRESLDG